MNQVNLLAIAELLNELNDFIHFHHKIEKQFEKSIRFIYIFCFVLGTSAGPSVAKKPPSKRETINSAPKSGPAEKKGLYLGNLVGRATIRDVSMDFGIINM